MKDNFIDGKDYKHSKIIISYGGVPIIYHRTIINRTCITMSETGDCNMTTIPVNIEPKSSDEENEPNSK